MAPGEDKKMSEDHNKGKLREGAVRCWCTAVRLARVPAGPEALRGCLVGKKQKSGAGGEGAHSILMAAGRSARLPGPRGGREATHPHAGCQHADEAPGFRQYVLT